MLPALPLATRGLVLAYRDQAVAAMFTRSCGGRTRTPQEVGLSSHAYPYFPGDLRLLPAASLTLGPSRLARRSW